MRPLSAQAESITMLICFFRRGGCMRVIDIERAEQLLDYLRHAAQLLDPHPELSALQLRQEMVRSRETLQNVVAEIAAAVTTGKLEAEIASLPIDDIF
jgi:hypothetical protein